MAATQTPATITPLDDRDARALTESMDIYADDPAAGREEIAVYNRGDRYFVSPATGFCTCKDWHYRQPEGGCKHYRRLQFEVGAREIPDWVDADRIDAQLGDQLTDMEATHD